MNRVVVCVVVFTMLALPGVTSDLERPGDVSKASRAAITESFEVGYIPPPGWVHHRTNPVGSWGAVGWEAHSGNYTALIYWHIDEQIEVLYSPPVIATAGFAVSLWSKGYVEPPAKRADALLRVFLDRDTIWNNGNETWVYNVDPDWVPYWQWVQSEVDLAAYADDTQYHVAFVFASVEEFDETYLDDIEVFGRAGDVLMFGDGLERGGTWWWSDTNPPIESTHYPYTGPPVTIQDNVPAGISTTITVNSTSPISDILVNVDIIHEARGDLIVTLTSPQGTEVYLNNRWGAWENHIYTTYDSPTAPDGPGAMSDFDGENPNGDWTLFVSDNAGGDYGYLSGWSLDITPMEN